MDTEKEALPDNFAMFPRMTRSLFPEFEGGLAKAILTVDAKSNFGAALGKKEHPYDFKAVINIKNFNIHHSTCIETKRDATVGIGFTSEKADDALDPLCDDSFQNIMSDMCEDYWQVGNGYIEVTREGATGPILGLYHMPSPQAFKVLEADGKWHWKISGGESNDKVFARFGDKEDFLKRFKDIKEEDVSEIIYFPRPTSLSRWYGYADWLSAVAIIELVQILIQHEFDFFLNRGVPEFLLFFLGSNIDTKTWEKLEANLKAHIGSGNSYKSSAFNFQDPNLTVELHKLGLGERQQGIFSEYYDTTAMAIVSAHRVPPLLAGIQIPGKLGATNELPNALMAFQLLVIGQAQRAIQKVLENTLGNSKINGGLKLNKDFELKKITDELDLDAMDTISRMREPAAGSNRDVSQGLKREALVKELLDFLQSNLGERNGTAA